MEIHGLEEYFDLTDEDKEICVNCINEIVEGEEDLEDDGELCQIVGAITITKNQVEEAEEDLKRRRSREQRREKKTRQGIRPNISSNCEKLEHLYSSEVEVESKKQRQYLKLLTFVVNFIGDEMRKVSPGFSKRVAEIYCGGSFFDGLKTDSQAQEFDMNILLQHNPDYFHLCGLGCFEGKENFCFLRAGGTKGCPNSMRLYQDTLSPLDMFKQLLSSVDKVISENNHVIEYHDGQMYRITRSNHKAPVTLKVEGLEDDIKFEVDLVPAVKIPRRKLYQFQYNIQGHCFGQLGEAYRETSSRIRSLRSQFGCTKDEADDFLAIALHKADEDKFEVDFHDLERKILKETGGCVKKVAKKMKQ